MEEIIKSISVGIGPGIVIGICLGLFLFYKGYKKLGLMKLIIISVTLWITMASIINPDDTGQASSVLNFLCSFIFAWILTEISTENQFKETQREMNMKSFRHSLQIRKQIVDTMEYLDKQKNAYEKCNSRFSEGSNCSAADKMESIINSLDAIKTQVDANLYDWSDEFAEELRNIKDIARYQEQLKIFDREMFYGEDSRLSKEKVDEFHSLRKDNHKIIKQLNKKVPPKMLNLLDDQAFRALWYEETNQNKKTKVPQIPFGKIIDNIKEIFSRVNVKGRSETIDENESM